MTESVTPRTPRLRTIALASGAGTSLEFYDFSLYATATALVFNQVFFIVKDPWFGDFLGFVTLAVGYFMAPLGAIFFGHLGDRLGRRRTLVLTFSIMGVATLLMGLLPGYRVLGVTAPVLLLILRLVHGFSRGGEVGGAALLAIEHAPAHKKGLYGSFVALGSPIGAGLATLAFMLLLQFFTLPQIVAGAWRIPFFAGAIIIFIGMYTRLHVTETPAFERMQKSHTLERRPLLAVLRESWRRVLLAAGVNLGFNAFMFILFTFLLAYGTQPVSAGGLGFARQSLVVATLVGCVAHALTILISSLLSDRIGAKPVMLVGGILMVLWTFPLMLLFTYGGLFGAQSGLVIGFALAGVFFGPLFTLFAHLFTPSQRYSGIGIGYQVGAALGGGISPLIANRLIAATHSALSVSIYLAIVMALSVICLALLPDAYRGRRAGAEDLDASAEVPTRVGIAN
ncbi:MAG: MFS transporter [Microbacteriaceae bacterium]|nr:MFS transporter [Microbacteriaceae bacterium]MCI1206810.1 MFS transporter [Microbacteriaceae bacterium]